MFLVNWLTANLLMVATVLVLLGIPVVILMITMNKKGPKAPEE
jgi:hypothetical protein